MSKHRLREGRRRQAYNNKIDAGPAPRELAYVVDYLRTDLVGFPEDRTQLAAGPARILEVIAGISVGYEQRSKA